MSNSPVIPVKEIEVPVPWGHVAGKIWGDEKDFPVLVLHGLLDNCGSFDRLIPLLPRTFCYICLDLPGHGRSSHFPDGLPLDTFNFILGVRFVVDSLKLSKFYLMGHSLGGQMSMYFSSVYPELVVKVICLDGIIPEPIPEESVVKHMRKRLENFASQPPGKSPPSYTYEEALERQWKNRPFELSKESAKIMIKRALIPTSSGFRFSGDQRLKGIWRATLTLEQIQNFVFNIQCPLILILAKDTLKKYAPIYGEKYVERLESLIYRAVDIRIVTVDGNHDVHLDHPERVDFHIASFLMELKSQL